MIEITFKGYIKSFYKEIHEVLGPFIKSTQKSKDRFIPSSHKEDG